MRSRNHLTWHQILTASIHFIRGLALEQQMHLRWVLMYQKTLEVKLKIARNLLQLKRVLTFNNLWWKLMLACLHLQNSRLQRASRWWFYQKEPIIKYIHWMMKKMKINSILNWLHLELVAQKEKSSAGFQKRVLYSKMLMLANTI